jgi:serine O-acetyltransferase
MKRIKKILAIFYTPLLFCYLVSNQKNIILQDVQAWKVILKYEGSKYGLLLQFLAGFPEFRSLYFYRLHQGNFLAHFMCYFLNWIYKGATALYIGGSDIGPGLFILHGFSTIILAEKIGANCRIFQQVTIGYSEDKCPILGDNVRVYAGAKVIGGITVGNNVLIGANAVVTKNVPDNCTVVGVPAWIARRNGIRVHEAL